MSVSRLAHLDYSCPVSVPPNSLPDRDSAQRRADQIASWRRELRELEAAGALRLEEEQRARVTAHHDALLARLAAEHDVDRTVAAGQLSRGMRITSFVAAVALTAAVASLVSQFWGRLELPVQATLLCAFPLIALGGVELSARRERTLYVASIFALVAYGTYWLALVVLSDRLNIPLTPAYVWTGALFGLALALPYRFRLVLAGALASLIVAIAGTVFQAAGIPWDQIASRLDMVTFAAFAVSLMAPRLGRVAPAFAPVTRLVALGSALFGLLVMSTFGGASLLPASNRTLEFVYQALTLLVSTALIVVAVRRNWTETVYLAAGVLTLFLLIRYVDWFWDEIPAFVFFLVLATIAIGWLVALRRIRQRLTRRPPA